MTAGVRDSRPRHFALLLVSILNHLIDCLQREFEAGHSYAVACLNIAEFHHPDKTANREKTIKAVLKAAGVDEELMTHCPEYHTTNALPPTPARLKNSDPHDDSPAEMYMKDSNF